MMLKLDLGNIRLHKIHSNGSFIGTFQNSSMLSNLPVGFEDANSIDKNDANLN